MSHQLPDSSVWSIRILVLFVCCTFWRIIARISTFDYIECFPSIGTTSALATTLGYRSVIFFVKLWTESFVSILKSHFLICLPDYFHLTKCKNSEMDYAEPKQYWSDMAPSIAEIFELWNVSQIWSATLHFHATLLTCSSLFNHIFKIRCPNRLRLTT